MKTLFVCIVCMCLVGCAGGSALLLKEPSPPVKMCDLPDGNSIQCSKIRVYMGEIPLR